MKVSCLRSWSLTTAFLLLLAPAYAKSPPRFDAPGNLLIVEQYGNRLIEIDTNTFSVVWSYEASVHHKTETNWLVGPRDADRIGAQTLIVAGGLPPGVSADYPDGYVDNRVFLIDQHGKILWQYGQTGVAGGGDNELNDPATAMMLPGQDILIADRGNHRIIHLRRQGQRAKLLWQYGTTGVSGSGTDQLNSPSSVQRQDNGHYLIADTGNNRVLEVVRKTNSVFWQYGNPADPSILNQPTYACRLSHGNTLIDDSGNNRILLVDPHGSNLFTYVTAARPGSVADPRPTHAVRLRSGNFLIADQFNHQVIEVNTNGVIVTAYGTIGVAGSGDGFLDAPCDAKEVKDFTGLSVPHAGGGVNASGYLGY